MDSQTSAELFVVEGPVEGAGALAGGDGPSPSRAPLPNRRELLVKIQDHFRKPTPVMPQPVSAHAQLPVFLPRDLPPGVTEFPLDLETLSPHDAGEHTLIHVRASDRELLYSLDSDHQVVALVPHHVPGSTENIFAAIKT